MYSIFSSTQAVLNTRKTCKRGRKSTTLNCCENFQFHSNIMFTIKAALSTAVEMQDFALVSKITNLTKITDPALSPPTGPHHQD